MATQDVRFTALRGANRKEKGGAPEDARQGIVMDTILEARAPDNGATSYQNSSERKKLGVWLDDLVSKSQAKPSARVISLTPDLAEVLLDRNPANRKISETLVESYSREIASGRWAFNGEPIIVSDTGELNDGQHRCKAVVEAGYPIDVILIVGVARDTRTTLDQGRVRTAGDFLSMDGNIYTNVLAAAASIAWGVRRRGMVPTGSWQRATKSEVLDFVRENPGLAKSVVLVHMKGADAAGGKSVLAATHFLLKSTRHKDDADHFILSVITGSGLAAGSPILYVRNRMINERRMLRNADRVELLFKAWNAWKRGEKLTRMQIVGGELPILEGSEG